MILILHDPVDGRNPAPVADRYIVYPVIYEVLYICGDAGFLSSTALQV